MMPSINPHHSQGCKSKKTASCEEIKHRRKYRPIHRTYAMKDVESYRVPMKRWDFDGLVLVLPALLICLRGSKGKLWWKGFPAE